MASLEDVVQFCNQRARVPEVKDFSGAFNGLQFANDGQVTKIGAAVDAGLIPFQRAAEHGIDFLVVHHGMFWNGAKPIVGVEYAKHRTLLEANLAVYGCHLPLDAHPEIGNSALLGKRIGATPSSTFLPYEGVDIGFVGTWERSREELRAALQSEFPGGIAAIEHGSARPKRICIVTGSGNSVIDALREAGADTLVTGELKQHFYNVAQELELNLYVCGHYATETYGVDALAREAANAFDLKYEFIKTDCPL